VRRPPRTPKLPVMAKDRDEAKTAKRLPVTDGGEDRRWAAVLARESACDDTFVYAVSSTGVYCRPSCPSRRPKRHLVGFFASPAEAETAGFRPCKRCRPDQSSLRKRQRQAVIAACRHIERAETPPALAELAAAAGLSASHFHRLFKAAVGMTPKAYGINQRKIRTRAQLRRSPSVTEAIYGAGFNSSGRFYAGSGETLGMTPGQYRKGGAETEIRYAVTDCWLGPMLVAASRRGICAILFDDDPAALAKALKRRFPAARLIRRDRDFEALVAKVAAHVEDPAAPWELPLDIRGTVFQAKVWEALRQIPAGRTASYAEIAAAIGAPKAVRAVAGACAANPIGVAVPCHRVIAKSGALAGYRGGVARKAALLKREAGKA
jgi:AraC family transcriptional regulator, regulatory protein of adaptative response / methylated-DNA-[protein]-cysteine methyltransferase